jgi:hypothetical protein
MLSPPIRDVVQRFKICSEPHLVLAGDLACNLLQTSRAAPEAHSPPSLSPCRRRHSLVPLVIEEGVEIES